jgi:hypothetical protein
VEKIIIDQESLRRFVRLGVPRPFAWPLLNHSPCTFSRPCFQSRDSVGKCKSLENDDSGFNGQYLSYATGSGGDLNPSSIISSWPWPPPSISNGLVPAYELPMYTPTGTVVTLLPPTNTGKQGEGARAIMNTDGSNLMDKSYIQQASRQFPYYRQRKERAKQSRRPSDICGEDRRISLNVPLYPIYQHRFSFVLSYKHAGTPLFDASSFLGRHTRQLPSVKFFITGRLEPHIRTILRLLLEPLTHLFLQHE